MGEGSKIVVFENHEVADGPAECLESKSIRLGDIIKKAD